MPWFWAPRPAPAAITQRDISQVGITTPPNAMLLLDLPLQCQDGIAAAPDDRVTPALAGLAVDPTTIRLAITEAGKGAATLETGKRLLPYPVNLEHEFHLNDRPKTALTSMAIYAALPSSLTTASPAISASDRAASS